MSGREKSAITRLTRVSWGYIKYSMEENRKEEWKAGKNNKEEDDSSIDVSSSQNLTLISAVNEIR